MDNLQERYDKLFRKLDEEKVPDKKEYIDHETENFYNGHDFFYLKTETYYALKEISQLEKETGEKFYWEEKGKKVLEKLVNKYIKFQLGWECDYSRMEIERMTPFRANDEIKQEICLNILASGDFKYYKETIKQFGIVPDKEKMKELYNIILPFHSSECIVNFKAFEHISGVKPNFNNNLLQKKYQELLDDEAFLEFQLLLTYSKIMPKDEILKTFTESEKRNCKKICS